jgi:NAD(P)H-hydrate epimerase
VSPANGHQPAPGEAPPPYDPREIIAVENLARTEALAVLGWVREGADERRDACVFAGRSNAGAAALAVARHLVNCGVDCRVLLCGPIERLPALVAAERAILLQMNAHLDEELTGEHLVRACEGIGPRTCVVDGAGSSCGPGREEAFAAAARGAEGAGRVARLDVPDDYRPPVPAEGDCLFSPDVLARTREEVRLLDSTAIERYRIPGVVLMENAGWRAAREAYAMLGFEPSGRVLVLAGPGNNGGDGFALARHLAGWGVEVEVVLLAAREKVMDDALVNLKLLESREEKGVRAPIRVTVAAFPEVVEHVLGERLPGSAVVIDAILGTGLSGNVRGAAARAIGMLNESSARVMAVDTPSGLDANTGEVLGVATTAEKTVTFAFAKKGFFLGEGLARTGEVVVADISMPRALWGSPE